MPLVFSFPNTIKLTSCAVYSHRVTLPSATIRSISLPDVLPLLTKITRHARHGLRRAVFLEFESFVTGEASAALMFSSILCCHRASSVMAGLLKTDCLEILEQMAEP